MMTGHEGIFAGGDMVPAERTVTVGVGHGKQAARNIDAWLRSAEFVHPPEPELASFEMLNTWYYADAPKTVAPAARRHPPAVELRGGHAGAGREQRAVRGPSLPELRQLLRL